MTRQIRVNGVAVEMWSEGDYVLVRVAGVELGRFRDEDFAVIAVTDVMEACHRQRQVLRGHVAKYH